jgi:hypothetical protein
MILICYFTSLFSFSGRKYQAGIEKWTKPGFGEEPETESGLNVEALKSEWEVL